MAQYQSFPDNPGDSRTLDKLKSLRLPDLSGCRFLDVGCNEGFFCGFASFQGASRSVGIDQSALFIRRARERFSRCEFFQQSWDVLPDGQFDVILLASALHYADNQPALIKKLVDKLSEDGVLVLELGIFSSRKAEWSQVQRGIDQRWFPSMPMLREVLADYAWKWLGPSISQDGDPVPRHVIHISRRRPLAYLLMQPPGYGKSSLASHLFLPAGIQVISGDQQIGLVAKGKVQVSSVLRELIAVDFSPFSLDQTLQKIYAADMTEELVDLWLAGAKKADIAIDGYVPEVYQVSVEQALRRRGYLPVQLRWDRIGPAPMPEEVIEEQGNAFYLSMLKEPVGTTRNGTLLKQARGFVDQVQIIDDQLIVRGWAVALNGQLPSQIQLKIKRLKLDITRIEKQLRPDVQRHLNLPQALVGYRAVCAMPAGLTRADVLEGLKVSADDGVVNFSFAAPLDQILDGGQ